MDELPESVGVQLGGESYVVVEQPLPRVFRQLVTLGKQVRQFGEDVDTSDVESFVVTLGDQVWDALHAFIPDLMPKWKFHGFSTKGAYEANEFDMDSTEALSAPGLASIIKAFEAAFAVNGGPRIGELAGKILGPNLAQAFQEVLTNEVSLRWQTSQLESGESDSESSTTTSPTTEVTGSSTTTSETSDMAANGHSAETTVLPIHASSPS